MRRVSRDPLIVAILRSTRCEPRWLAPPVLTSLTRDGPERRPHFEIIDPNVSAL
jgi:hypothetical protein